MESTLSDTDRDAERVQIALMRQSPSWRKLYLLGQLNQTVKLMALSGLRQRHPQATEEACRKSRWAAEASESAGLPAHSKKKRPLLYRGLSCERRTRRRP